MNRKMVTIIPFWVLCLLLLAVPGLTATYTWNGLDSDWDIASNWSPNGIPGFPDKAIINNSHEVAVTHLDGIYQLEIASGSALKIGFSTPDTASIGFQNGTNDDYILNNGTIRVGGPGYYGKLISWGDNVTLLGTGAIILGGHYPQDAIGNSGGGVSFTNTASHTIQGGGYIQGLKANQGQVIADNSTLWIQCPTNNTGGTMSASGSGNELAFWWPAAVTGGAINPQDGKVTLANGTTFENVTFGPGLVEVNNPGSIAIFNNTNTLSAGTSLNLLAGSHLGFGPENGNATLVNNGAITMNGGGGSMEGSAHLTLQGAGSLTMGGDGDNYLGFYDINLQAPQIIQGGGTIQSEIISNSTIIANHGTLTAYLITGNGTVSVTDGATLNVPGSLQTGDLTMSRLAALTIQDAVILVLSRNFSFAQIDPANWSWGTNTELQMSGQGFHQTLEVGGQDFGATPSGYDNNFALPELAVTGVNTYVSLVDAIDNGHRAGGREALYVSSLEVGLGATLNLNGLHLYAMRGGIVYRVQAGQGALYGGGRIIDKAASAAINQLLLLME
jgi:hypothetical protein